MFSNQLSQHGRELDCMREFKVPKYTIFSSSCFFFLQYSIFYLEFLLRSVALETLFTPEPYVVALMTFLSTHCR